MTCQETIAFYAALALPASASARKEQAQDVLREMGLTSASTTLVCTCCSMSLRMQHVMGDSENLVLSETAMASNSTFKSAAQKLTYALPS